ncbi:MAG: hypothetical protein ACYCXZ_08550 [Coriobacteriia bacterium]
MVTKETCPVCKGNKFVEIERTPGSKDRRQCHGCNGTGFRVRVTIPGSPSRY